MAAVDYTANTQASGNGVFAKIVALLEKIANSNGRVRQVEFLNSLTDEQLKARGLTRDQIVHHVFRDCYYI